MIAVPDTIGICRACGEEPVEGGVGYCSCCMGLMKEYEALHAHRLASLCAQLPRVDAGFSPPRNVHGFSVNLWQALLWATALIGGGWALGGAAELMLRWFDGVQLL